MTAQGYEGQGHLFESAKEYPDNSGIEAEHFESRPQLSATVLAVRSWLFPDVFRGDCHIRSGARFSLFSDGSTHWVCDISSSSDDDAWLGFFRCSNSLGTVLFDQGGYNFNIAEENVVKRWDEFRGPDPRLARAFNEASGLSFFCRC